MQCLVYQHDFAFNSNQRLTLGDLESNWAMLDEGALEPSMACIHSTTRGALLMKRMHSLVEAQLMNTGPIKLRVVEVAVYGKMGGEEGHHERVLSHPGAHYRVVAAKEGIKGEFTKCMDEVDYQMETARDSLRFMGFCGLQLLMCRHSPLCMGMGRAYIPLPRELVTKKALVNIKNSDDMCFLYCLLCGLLHASDELPEHPERVTVYKKYMGRIQVPQSASVPPHYNDYERFEVINNMSINIYRPDGRDSTTVHPYFTTARDVTANPKRHVNLLLISENGDAGGTSDRDPGRQHYVCITNMSRLVTSKVSKNGHKLHFCAHCNQHFPNLEALTNHASLRCRELVTGSSAPPSKVVMPAQGKHWCLFKNPQNTLRRPAVIYADLEAANIKVSSNPADTTRVLTRHQATSYSMCVVSSDGTSQLSKHSATDPVDLISHFMDAVFVHARLTLDMILDTDLPMCWTEAEQEQHGLARSCYACGGPFGDNEAERRVADHDHLTGEYRGAAHCSCNLKMRKDRHLTLPIVFHNLKNYDTHHLLANVAEYCRAKHVKIEVIPLNREKLITFSMSMAHTTKKGTKAKVRVQFLDSFQFLPSSLETLVSSQRGHGMHKFALTQRHMHDLVVHGHDAGLAPCDHDAQMLELVTRKGVFPYEWFDGVDKLHHNKLPPQELFHSSLTGSTITDADYAHGQHMWATWGCTTIQEYLEGYMQTDVLLLADVLEGFRSWSMQHFKLDPLGYCTLPGLGFDALLKMTGQRLQLLTDEDMHVFVERGIRGGVSVISHRHAQANNPYMSDFDPTQGTSYITYLDANSLYPWAMQRALPTGGFRWLDVEQLGGVQGVQRLLDTTPDDDPHGYMFQVDIEYPAHLHNAHNDLPFAPERIVVGKDTLSPVNQQFLNKHGCTYTEEERLVPSLLPKQAYVVHYRALKQMLSHGLQLKAVSRCLRFEQSPWMKPYIDFCVGQRQAAVSDFDKDLFKLLMNSVFGKTMENVRRRTKVRVFTTGESGALLRCLASPFMRGVTIISPNMVAVEMHRTSVRLNKPLYVGAAILDIAKTLVYEFHYNHMMQQYGHKRCRLLFTDTDSLCYHVSTEDVYVDMARDRSRFDLSAYPRTHFLHDVSNNKVAGKFKDETHGLPITEFVGLKAKMYAYTTQEQPPDTTRGFALPLHEHKRAKGVARAALRASITLNDYKAALQGGIRMRVDMHLIRSRKHVLQTICMNKVALSAFDSKRYVLDDGVHTLAYGHHRVGMTN